MKQKIRIGVLFDRYEHTLAEFEMIKKIIHSESSLLVVSIQSLGSVNNHTSESIIYSAYRWLDKAFFKGIKDFTKKEDLRPLLLNIPQMVVRISSDTKVGTIALEDREYLKQQQLDILIQIGNFEVCEELTSFAKYGVWTTRLFDPDKIKTLIPVYWEFNTQRGEIGSVVEMLKEGSEKAVIIYRSWELMNHYSYYLNQNRVFGRASLFIPRMIEALYLYGDGYLTHLENKYNRDISFDNQSWYRNPSALVALKNVCGVFLSIIKHLYKKIFYIDYWFLLIKINDKKSEFSTSFSNFKRIDTPKDRFWADPFIISRESRNFLFVEEYINKTKKGHISVLELDSAGTLISSKKIIDHPYHMAYPFIFEHDGFFYMIPDTSQNRTIELYKCVSFPHNWEFVKVLMSDIYAADTTLFYYHDKWWLFTSLDETSNVCGYDSELSLFYADDFMSTEWKRHPQNPIISDAKRARGAGRIFIHRDQIFRPSQYCHTNYGKGFNLNRIKKLSEFEYEEELYTRVIPDWDLKIKGTHTFNFDGNFTVIDAFTHRSRIKR